LTNSRKEKEKGCTFIERGKCSIPGESGGGVTQSRRQQKKEMRTALWKDITFLGGKEEGETNTVHLEDGGKGVSIKSRSFR